MFFKIPEYFWELTDFGFKAVYIVQVNHGTHPPALKEDSIVGYHLSPRVKFSTYLLLSSCQIFCLFHSKTQLLSFHVSDQIVIYSDVIIFTRYIFIFWLKNPFIFQDEFWYLFVNIWTVMYTVLSEFAFFYVPGRQPMEFYICTGILNLKAQIS